MAQAKVFKRLVPCQASWQVAENGSATIMEQFLCTVFFKEKPGAADLDGGCVGCVMLTVFCLEEVLAEIFLADQIR